jgi:hypothetical protein
MASEVIKALKLTYMENELIDINREIKLKEYILNSPRAFFKQKEKSKKGGFVVRWIIIAEMENITIVWSKHLVVL